MRSSSDRRDAGLPRAARPRLALLIIAAAAFLATASGLLAPLASRLADLRFMAAPRPATGGIVLVEIDAKSLREIGRWPWQRGVHADLVRALRGLGAAEIAFDVDFSAASTEAEDGRLESALRDAEGTVVLATFQQRLSGASEGTALVDNRPLDRFRDHVWTASVNVWPEADGRVRTMPYGGTIAGEAVPSLAAFLGGAPLRSGSFAIDFGIRPETVDRIPAIDVLRGLVPRERLEGRKAVIGATALELRDFFQVPGHGTVSGALLQAVAAETLLQGRALAGTGLGLCALGLAALVGLIAAAQSRFDWRLVLAGLLAVSVLIEGLTAGLLAIRPVLVETASWQLMLLGAAGVTVAREIDLRRLLLAITRVRAHNVQLLLDRVISDNLDGIVVVDGRGIVQAASRAATDLLLPGEAGDWRQRPMADLLPPPLQREVEKTLSEAPEGEGPGRRVPREIAIHLATAGERVLEYLVTPSRLAEGPDGASERTIACLTFRDITERRVAEKRLAYLARFDVLTGLPNRAAFTDRLGETAEAARRGTGGCVVLYFDLDRFKGVNDTFGHGVGDLVLQEVARRCLKVLPSPHLVARFGGDEFAVALKGSTAPEEVAAVAETLIERLSQPYEIMGQRLSIGASIGIADLGEAGGDTATLLKNADTALYRAKRDGGGTYRFFDHSMAVELHARHRLEVELRDALDRKEFEVFYQPQFELRSGELTGVEALLRWRHPERGYVSPAEFVPVAEEIGLIEPLGEWVLQQACRDVAGWPRRLKLAVNVSPVQFTRRNLVEQVEKALARSGLPATQLDLEITESLFLQEHNEVLATMDALRARGIGFALDDFGTGYSSLSYVRRFPITKIKIDRSFVSGIPHDPEAVAIIQAVIAIATNLGLRTNAEGLEQSEQTSLLRLLGCDEGQGYGLGRPEPASAILRLLAAQPNRVA